MTIEIMNSTFDTLREIAQDEEILDEMNLLIDFYNVNKVGADTDDVNFALSDFIDDYDHRSKEIVARAAKHPAVVGKLDARYAIAVANLKTMVNFCKQA